jgi:hypothetical protein
LWIEFLKTCDEAEKSLQNYGKYFLALPRSILLKQNQTLLRQAAIKRNTTGNMQNQAHRVVFYHMVNGVGVHEIIRLRQPVVAKAVLTVTVTLPGPEQPLAEDTVCTMFGNKTTLSGEQSSLEWHCQGHGQHFVKRFVDKDACCFTVKIKDAPAPLNLEMKDNVLRIAPVAEEKKEDTTVAKEEKAESLLERAKRFLANTQPITATIVDVAPESSTPTQTSPKPFMLEIALPANGFSLAEIKGVLTDSITSSGTDDSTSKVSNTATTSADAANTTETVTTVEQATDISERLRKGEVIPICGESLELFVEIDKCSAKDDADKKLTPTA